MPKLNDKEYQCDCCHGIFQLVRNETWSEEKANEEYKKLFPNESIENREIVCNDCWEIVRPDRN